MSVRLERKWEDAWIGVSWKRSGDAMSGKRLDIWICLVPCFPIHITRLTKPFDFEGWLNSVPERQNHD